MAIFHRASKRRTSAYVNDPASANHGRLGTLGRRIAGRQVLTLSDGSYIWASTDTLERVDTQSENAAWKSVDGKYRIGDTVSSRRMGVAEVIAGPVPTPLGIVYRLKDKSSGNEYDEWEHDLYVGPTTHHTASDAFWDRINETEKTMARPPAQFEADQTVELVSAFLDAHEPFIGEVGRVLRFTPYTYVGRPQWAKYYTVRFRGEDLTNVPESALKDASAPNDASAWVDSPDDIEGMVRGAGWKLADFNDWRENFEQGVWNMKQEDAFKHDGITPDQRHNQRSVEEEHMPESGSRVILTAPSGFEREGIMFGSSFEPYTGPTGSWRIWFQDEDGDITDHILGNRWKVRPATPMQDPFTPEPGEAESLIRNAGWMSRVGSWRLAAEESDPDWSFVYYTGEVKLVEWSHQNRYRQILKDLLSENGKELVDDIDDTEIVGGTVTNGKVEFEGFAAPEVREEAEAAIAKELGSSSEAGTSEGERAPIEIKITIDGWQAN